MFAAEPVRAGRHQRQRLCHWQPSEATCTRFSRWGCEELKRCQVSVSLVTPDACFPKPAVRISLQGAPSAVSMSK